MMIAKFLFAHLCCVYALFSGCPAVSQKQAFKNPQTFESDTCNDDEANPYCCFRDMPAGATHVMTIAGPSEAGQPMVIQGRIFKRDGKTPYSGVKLYAYHTNQKGIYPKKGNETGVHRWHGYLHGWCRTDAEGRYEIHTIRPAQYPTRDIPAHIHAYVWEPDGKKPYYISDFVFADDKLIDERYLRSVRNIPGGTGLVTLNTNGNGTAEGVRDIVLPTDDELPVKDALYRLTLPEAEKILGEPARLTDSTLRVKDGVLQYSCAYTATGKGQKTDKTGAVYFIAEQYKQVESAKAVYSEIKTSNENHEGVKVLHDLGDEAYFHSSENFCFILVRKGAKMIRIKVNKITRTTSVDAFNTIAKNITETL